MICRFPSVFKATATTSSVNSLYRLTRPISFKPQANPLSSHSLFGISASSLKQTPTTRLQVQNSLRVCRYSSSNTKDKSAIETPWCIENSKGRLYVPGSFFNDWKEIYNKGNGMNFPDPYDGSGSVTIIPYHRPEAPLDFHDAIIESKREQHSHLGSRGLLLKEYLLNCDTTKTYESLGGTQITQHADGLAMMIHNSHRYFLKIVESNNGWRLLNEVLAAFLLSMCGNLARSSVPKTQVIKLQDGRFMNMRRYFSGADARLLYEVSKQELVDYLGEVGPKEIASLYVYVYVVMSNIDRFNDGNLVLSGDYFNSKVKIGPNPLRNIDLEGCFADRRWLDSIDTQWKEGEPIPATLEWSRHLSEKMGEDAFVDSSILGMPEINRVNPFMLLLSILMDNDLEAIKNISFDRQDFQDLFDSRLMVAKALKMYQVGSESDIISGKTNIQEQITRLYEATKNNRTISFKRIISGL